MNSVSIVGRLGKDPEARYFESGKSVCNFNVAIDQGRDNPPLWLTVEAWNKTGEIVTNHCRKGSLVGVQGALKEEKWTDRQTGQERTRITVSAYRVTLCGSSRDRDQQPAPATPAAAPATQSPPAPRQQAPAQQGWDNDPPF